MLDRNAPSPKFPLLTPPQPMQQPIRSACTGTDHQMRGTRFMYSNLFLISIMHGGIEELQYNAGQITRFGWSTRYPDDPVEIKIWAFFSSWHVTSCFFLDFSFQLCVHPLPSPFMLGFVDKCLSVLVLVEGVSSPVDLSYDFISGTWVAHIS
jgi:hypothetical protein